MIKKRFKLNKREMLECTGSMKQFCGIDRVQYCEGKSKGVEALFFRTGSGLNFTVLPDRGLDIYNAEYNGIPLAYLTPAGVVSPKYYDKQGWSWIRTFGGGLLTTCGLLNVGPPCEFEGELQGAHGRISTTPAENVIIYQGWIRDKYFLTAQGTLREERLNKYNLKMERVFEVLAGEREIHVEDRITNEGYRSSPLMILYHINIGYPFLSEKSFLMTSLKSLLPRDPDTEDGKKEYNRFEKPRENYFEKCYFHIMNQTASGKAMAGIFNPEFEDGIGVVVEWKVDELPRMTQWKMLGKGLYVNGLEPANCWCDSVANEVKRKGFRPIEPGERRDFKVKISVVASKKEIEQKMKVIQALAAPKLKFLPPIIKERSKSL